MYLRAVAIDVQSDQHRAEWNGGPVTVDQNATSVRAFIRQHGIMFAPGYVYAIFDERGQLRTFVFTAGTSCERYGERCMELVQETRRAA